MRLGEHNYNDDHDGAEHADYDVAESVQYPDYNYPVAYHDLALIRLATRVPFKVSLLRVTYLQSRRMFDKI